MSIDISAFEGRDPYQDYVIINNELSNFSEKLLNKPQIVIANKIDIGGKVLIISMSIPIIASLLETIIKILP